MDGAIVSRPRIPAIRDQVADLRAQGLEDPEAITERILQAQSREALVDIVRPVVAWQVSQTLRAPTQSGSQRHPSVHRQDNPAGVARVDDLRGLLRTTFSLPDGGRVEFGRATREQHQLRAVMLHELSERASIEAARHEHAAQELAGTTARCLADLYARRDLAAEGTAA